MSKPELRPCPFCGKPFQEPLFFRGDEEWELVCRTCDYHIKRSALKDLAQVVNRRAADPAVVAQIAAIRAAFDSLAACLWGKTVRGAQDRMRDLHQAIKILEGRADD